MAADITIHHSVKDTEGNTSGFPHKLKTLLSYLLAFAAGLAIPLAPHGWVLILAFAVLLAPCVMIIRLQDIESYSRDRSVPLENFLMVFTIPIVTIVITLGSSIGVYFVTKYPHLSGWPWATPVHSPLGWSIVGYSLGISLLILIGQWTMLVRHRHGTSVLPFEADADPAKAIATLERWSRPMHTWLLPGISLSAQELALQQAGDPSDGRAPSVWKALLFLGRNQRPSYRQDRRHAMFIVLGSLSILVTSFLLHLLHGGNWRYLGFAALYSIGGLVGIAWIAAEIFVILFYAYRKYDLRMAHLRERERSGDGVLSWQRTWSDDLEKLRAEVRELSDLVRALNVSAEAKRSPMSLVAGRRLQTYLLRKVSAVSRFL